MYPILSYWEKESYDNMFCHFFVMNSFPGGFPLAVDPRDTPWDLLSFQHQTKTYWITPWVLEHKIYTGQFPSPRG